MPSPRCAGVHRARSSRLTCGERHGGTLTNGTAAAHRLSDLRRKHGCEVGVVPGNRKAVGLTRTARHRRGRKTGPVAATSSMSAVISGERQRRLKAPAALGSPVGGEGQDQSIERGPEVAFTEEG
jgi:hypothetical protein